ncbi:hypothetical protein, partial [Escherichia marmotae]|uniref:hypothetical protein n=1 Tax=Escherichia marmotae TaxID=1499973 RepID=UPI00215A375E
APKSLSTTAQNIDIQGGEVKTFFNILSLLCGAVVTAVTAQALPKSDIPIYKATIGAVASGPNKGIAKGKASHPMLV